jgi:hypothetical protein
MSRSPQSHFQRAEAGHNQVHAFYFATPKSARTSQDTVRRTCILVARFSTHLIPDTIAYVATDQTGLTATSTRAVVVVAPHSGESPIGSTSVIIQAANANTPPLDTSTMTPASTTQ